MTLQQALENIFRIVMGTMKAPIQVFEYEISYFDIMIFGCLCLILGRLLFGYLDRGN